MKQILNHKGSKNRTGPCQGVHLKQGWNLLTTLLFASLALQSCQSKTAANEAGAPGAIPELIYTKHARCRMECRHINESEIKEIIGENHINQRKSNPNGNPCPTDAYDGYSNEHQHLRIVIAKCDNTWKVVTCIDLDNEFECDCK